MEIGKMARRQRGASLADIADADDLDTARAIINDVVSCMMGHDPARQDLLDAVACISRAIDSIEGLPVTTPG